MIIKGQEACQFRVLTMLSSQRWQACSKMSLIFIRILVFIRGGGIQPGRLGINEKGACE